MLKINNYQRVYDPNSCVVAKIDVTIVEYHFDVRITECRKGKGHWFNWPSEYIKDPTGLTKGKYIPAACFNSEEICKRFFNSLREELKKHQAHEQEQGVPF